MKHKIQTYLVVTAFVLGLIIVFQSRAYFGVSEIYQRDLDSNVFQEISLLKQKNEDLESEIEVLEDSLENLADRNSVLLTIEEEIEKYSKLTGQQAIFGPGISLNISGAITVPWMVDLVNEFFKAGAQAVSVNGIRITNSTVGFDSLPKGEIMINGAVLNEPYEISGIGEASDLRDILNLPGGILDRLLISFPELELELDEKEIIKMD